MELLLVRPERYRVRRGQTLEQIAEVFGTTPRLLAACNHLTAPPEVSIERGTELRITVRARAAHAKPFGVL